MTEEKKPDPAPGDAAVTALVNAPSNTGAKASAPILPLILTCLVALALGIGAAFAYTHKAAILPAPKVSSPAAASHSHFVTSAPGWHMPGPPRQGMP